VKMFESQRVQRASADTAKKLEDATMESEETARWRQHRQLRECCVLVLFQ
jgi:hypothetical protein